MVNDFATEALTTPESVRHWAVGRQTVIDPNGTERMSNDKSA